MTTTTEETTAGNYFISNYPPYSFWGPDQAPAAHQALEQAPAPGTPLGVYAHIPFCRKRCHFCYFRVYTDKNAGEVKIYLDAALKELAIYAKKPFVGGRKPAFVYFGGGTPSYLSVAQLHQLTDGMKELLPWDEAGEVAFEAEPGTLTEKKLQAIRDIGVTRLSLGVENFDDHILEINGRAHRSKEILRAYEQARALGFPQINIDLIAGMVEEREENWQRCIEKTIELQPDCVTIYQMEIPYNTTIFKEMKAQGRLVAPVANWQTKRRWVEEAFAALEQVGYTVTSAYTAVRDPQKTRFLYRDLLWQGADLIGAGVASFSHVNGVHFQNQHDIGPYLQQLERDKLPIYRAYRTSEEERMIRELILQLKLGRVNLGYFETKFGVDVRARFADVLGSLEEAGHLRMSDTSIVLTRAALLEVDQMLWDFFLPEHQHARYA